MRSRVRAFRPGLRRDTDDPRRTSSFIPRPILGWFGVVDERVDYDLLGEMAAHAARLVVRDGRARSSRSIPTDLPQAPNLHWLGGRDYKELAQLLQGFDVCMMAFALNEATEFINPTKALEYLATGKPVISTPVRDVVRQYSDLVYVESDAGRICRKNRADPREHRFESDREGTGEGLRMLVGEHGRANASSYRGCDRR